MTRFFAILSALLLAPAIFAQPTETDLRHHIEILASDAFQGRRPGTPGERVAAHYIASQFAQAGLGLGYRGSFYQPVPLIERHSGTASAGWTSDGDDGVWDDEDFVALGRTAEINLRGAPAIFAGYALDIGDPEGSLAGTDLTGAAVLLLAGTPDNQPDAPAFRDRRRLLAEAGAAVVIGLIDDDTPWEAIRESYAQGRTVAQDTVMAPVEGALSPDAAGDLFETNNLNLRRLYRAAALPDFRAVDLDTRLDIRISTGVREYRAYNVVARLPGSGDSGEAIVFLAHYDHFGVCRPQGAEDRICNGAVDNASGTAALIEVARGLADGPRPERDMFFVATTAEELGLLGAYAFAEHPPLPLDDIVAALNLDTIAIAQRGAAVGIVGRGMTDLDPVVDAVAEELGRPVYDGLEPNAFVQRQDGWALLEAGVPAIMAGGSFTDPEPLEAFLNGPYHGPEDDLDQPVELGGAYEDVLLHIALGHALGNPARYPAPSR